MDRKQWADLPAPPNAAGKADPDQVVVGLSSRRQSDELETFETADLVKEVAWALSCLSDFGSRRVRMELSDYPTFRSLWLMRLDDEIDTAVRLADSASGIWSDAFSKPQFKTASPQIERCDFFQNIGNTRQVLT